MKLKESTRKRIAIALSIWYVISIIWLIATIITYWSYINRGEYDKTVSCYIIGVIPRFWLYYYLANILKNRRKKRNSSKYVDVKLSESGGWKCPKCKFSNIGTNICENCRINATFINSKEQDIERKE